MAIFRKRRAKKKSKIETAGEIPGISPDPMTNLILTDIALRGATRLARRMTEQAMLRKRYTKETARKVIDGRSITETLVATAIARTATRSVPGAIFVGGGVLVKALYDRRRGRMAKVDGRKALRKRMANAED